MTVELGPGAVGVIADIHANPYALRAVLAHGRSLGVDRWLVLGDVVAMGPEPGQVLDLLDRVAVVAWVAGNTERYVLTGDRPDPTLEDVAADPGLLPRLVDVIGSFAWTKGVLHGQDRLQVLRSFEATVDLRCPDGTDVLLVHASTVADDGVGITPDVEPEQLRRLFPDLSAELVFGCHTHQATDRVIGGTRFVNPGSVSNHHRPELDAGYAILRLDRHGHDVELHQVGYDKQQVIDSIRTSGIPGSHFLLSRYFDTTR